MIYELSVRCSTDRVGEVEEELNQAHAIAVSLRNGDESKNQSTIDGKWAFTQVTALMPEHVDLRECEVALSKLGCDGFRAEILDELQWSQSLHQPRARVLIGPFVIGDSLENVSSPLVPLYIPAGLAFGTGEHETTALCLEWLAEKNLREKHVLDLGCGSGILAIAAMKLGAASATAIDNDQDALQVTESNALRNNVNLSISRQLEIEVSFDFVVANIYADTLIQYAERLRHVLNPGGLLALSGVLENQIEQVQRSYPDIQFDVIQVRNDWALLAGSMD